MKINFGMWRKASWELIKMDDKREWEALDVVSKWLIATRSAVTMVTVYSCVIAGLLAWRDGYFSLGPWLILTFGLFLAHGANNLLNDYTDFSRGLDKDNYFRTQYGVHPLHARSCAGSSSAGRLPRWQASGRFSTRPSAPSPSACSPLVQSCCWLIPILSNTGGWGS